MDLRKADPRYRIESKFRKINCHLEILTAIGNEKEDLNENMNEMEMIFRLTLQNCWQR